MIYEYAVQPEAIGADWETFRYLIEKFGVEHGRLISCLPGLRRAWEKNVMEAAKNSGFSEINRARTEVMLSKSKHRTGNFHRYRRYDNKAPWARNILLEHTRRPFRAIICNEGEILDEKTLTPDECSDDHPLFRASSHKNVKRTAEDIADTLFHLVLVSKEIDLVDPYFDLASNGKNYAAPLKRLFEKLVAVSSTPKTIRIHKKPPERCKSNPSFKFFKEKVKKHMKGVLPDGFSLEIYTWSERSRGEDFHDRYLLTEKGGITLGAGFSSTTPAETTTAALLGMEYSQKLRSRFHPGSKVYKIAEKAVRILSSTDIRLFDPKENT